MEQGECFDAIASTNTFEHIPKSEIANIVGCLYSALDDAGVCSIIIDYTDHYSHTDPKISALNFLRFSEERWARYNHRSHHQNRLRHSDYVEAFVAAGFDVEVLWVRRSAGALPEVIDSSFRGLDDLDATSAHFLLRKQPFV